MVRNKLYYENRIKLLSARPADCSKVIAKLKRKIRLLENK